MKQLEHIAAALSGVTAGIASWLKAALLSRRPSPKGNRPHTDELVILGNGPSLRHTLETDRAGLARRKTMAVNFAANTPEFTELKPDYYVLADPHFFDGENTDRNVVDLWKHIEQINWPVCLYVPCKRLKAVRTRMAANTCVCVKGFNLTPAEGSKALVYPLYNLGLGMPRPRNVLIPAIMAGIREGFGTIYIAGADHTWSRTLEVDEHNRVVSVQPHFYKDNDNEKARVTATYSQYRLHDILKSLYVAFKSYHQIQAWVGKRGVKIYNISPGSFIDAFDRLDKLP